MIERDASELKRLGNLGTQTRIAIEGVLPLSRLGNDQWYSLLASLDRQPLMQGLAAEQQKRPMSCRWPRKIDTPHST